MSSDDATYIREALDKVRDTLEETRIILARNTTTLEVHVKRCDLLEAKMKPLEEQAAQIQGWKHSVGFIIKLIGVSVSILALSRALMQIF